MGDEENAPPTCHCQAGRLMIIAGPANDAAINAARTWALSNMTGPHDHVISYVTSFGSSPDFMTPSGPDGKGGLKPFKKNKVSDAMPALRASFKDECFWQEIVVVAHGNQTGLYDALAHKLLNKILDRPTRKLVFWVCGGDREHYPFTTSARLDPFLDICKLVRPRAKCPCGCHEEDCHAYDYREKPFGHCHGKGLSTKVLSAGYHTASDGKKYPSNLSVDPAQKDFFGAPDGSLIETAVTSGDGKCEMQSDETHSGQDVLGNPVRGTPAPPPPNSPIARNFDPNAYFGKKGHRERKVDKKDEEFAGYTGPKNDPSQCPHYDGCLPGRP